MLFFFFFNDTATTEIYTLSLHDALPISRSFNRLSARRQACNCSRNFALTLISPFPSPCFLFVLSVVVFVREWTLTRSEEHTSELQSQSNLVCRLLLEKKKKNTHRPTACSRQAQRQQPTLLHGVRRQLHSE